MEFKKISEITKIIHVDQRRSSLDNKMSRLTVSFSKSWLNIGSREMGQKLDRSMGDSFLN
jgi:hypothetical protein